MTRIAIDYPASLDSSADIRDRRVVDEGRGGSAIPYFADGATHCATPSPSFPDGLGAGRAPNAVERSAAPSFRWTRVNT
jgi:hypothetical protein